MSLFRNQNFINQIIKEIGLSKVNQETCEILQALVQIETRKLIQHSAKFMNSDNRDQINFQDVQNALTDLNHTDIILTDQEEKYMKDGSTFIRSDPLFKTAKEFIEEQTKLLPLSLFQSPSLKGRWIYIDGKIPKTGDNLTLKSKTDILSVRNKALKQKDKKFNVISDCPQNLFTTIEEDYFKDVTSLLSSLSVSQIGKLQDVDIGGNITNLSPMLLNYFNSTQITEAKMIYFLKMLQNKYFNKSIQFYLHQILAYLWAYEGSICYKVGLKIAELILKYSQKYPILYRFGGRDNKDLKKLDMFQRDTLYATVIKRIAIQFTIGITVDINDKLLQICQLDAKDGNMLAINLKETVHQYSSQISSLNQQLSIFSMPEGLKDDPYLMMPW